MKRGLMIMNAINTINSTEVKDVIEVMLEPYNYLADEYVEDDGSITLSLVEMDLMDNGKDKDEALTNLAKYILTYSEHYFEFFDEWSAAPNRKPHLPYVLKAAMLNDIVKVKELIVCRPGKN